MTRIAPWQPVSLDMTDTPDPENRLTFQAPSDGRLDVVVTAWLQAHPLPDRQCSRSQIASFIEDGLVTVGKRVVTKPAHKVQSRTHIQLRLPPPPATSLVPEEHDFDLLYCDDHLLVVNKPAGLRVHPTPADPTDSLVAGILGRDLSLAPAGGDLRPGVVHRLDKTTSGVMVLARTDAAYHQLVVAFRQRTLTKQYLALTAGHLPQMAGDIDAPIGRDPAHRKRFAVVGDGKASRSAYQVLERTPVGDRVELALHTGRTHQLRVHLRYSGAPVMGDRTYGGVVQSALITRLASRAEGWGGDALQARRALQEIAGLLQHYPGNCLHAWRLGFAHPLTGEPLQFEAPLPDVLGRILNVMRSSTSR